MHRTEMWVVQQACASEGCMPVPLVLRVLVFVFGLLFCVMAVTIVKLMYDIAHDDYRDAGCTLTFTVLIEALVGILLAAVAATSGIAFIWLSLAA